MHHKRKDNFCKFVKHDLKDYPMFVEIITRFQNHYHLNRFSLREIDIFLWLAGKDSFPRKYKKA